jgi:hypothetical protein
MATIKQIITIQEVQAKVPTDAHFDINKFAPNIGVAQFRWGQEFLGDVFFEELLNEKPTFSTQNQALWDNYLQEYLAWSVLYESRMNIQWSVSTQGFMLNNTEFSQSDKNAIETVSKMITTKLDTFQRMIDKFLIENNTDYPTYIKNIQLAANPHAKVKSYAQYFGCNFDEEREKDCN